jgi:hypothetical protein
MVLQDSTRGKSLVQHAGAKGMTAHQVVRSAVVGQDINPFSHFIGHLVSEGLEMMKK